MSGNTSRQTNLGNEINSSILTSSANQPSDDYVPNTHRFETGPAPTTAGPHQSDIANKLDPRVDSDLNNRAQYAPGTTTTNNTHAGATRYMSNPESTNNGPHPSNIMNKLDPRVNSKTGETTTKSTNGEGSGPAKEPVQRGDKIVGGTQRNIVPGSSTEAPAAPNPASGTTYNRDAPQAYNAAVGTGYNPGPDTGYNNNPGTSANYNTGSNSEYNSGTNTQGYQAAAPIGSSTTTGGNQQGTAGSGTGSGGIKSAIAGIHGIGESIRGTIGAAIDRKFGDQEGAAKNEAIAGEGEYQINSGNFARSTKEREGINVNKRDQQRP